MYARVNFYNSIDEFNKVKHNTAKMYLIFITDKTTFNLEELNLSKLKFVGGIFPTIIYKSQTFSEGLMVFELNDISKVHFVENIDSYKFNKNLFTGVKSIVTILDGFSQYNSSFLENVFENTNLDTNIIGGGAGVFTDSSRKVVFNNNGIYKNASFLILLNEKVEMGVGHGWDILEGPHVSTNVEEKILKEIDYKNAFEVYKEGIEKNTNIILTKDNYSEVIKEFPLGIVKFNADSLVREIVDFGKNGEIILAGDIQPNSVINILKGEKESLIKDAIKAGKSATKSDAEILMMFECVSRLDYLGEDFKKLINSVIDETTAQHIFGVVSIGEIANDGNKYIYFLNKSCVMGGICL